MRRGALTILILLFASLPAGAKIGSIDLVPAATLLVPYWEADADSPSGVDTLVTITNASATAILAHATLWTDYGIPTDTFDIYLTGYDTETFSLREIVNRLVPVTASNGQDLNDTASEDDGISNKGILSQDINFASCTGHMPGVERFMTGEIALAHTGQEAPEYFGVGNCGASDYGDGISRGYLTIDTVSQCDCGATPATPGYFSGIATYQNVLVGEVTFHDPGNGRHFTEPAVHIEASSAFNAGDYTFYARFTGNSAIDDREALPTAWIGKWAADRTTAEYWRDPGVPVLPFACGGAPFVLDEQQIRAFDQNGASVGAITGDRFPLAAGLTSGTPDLGLDSGWGSLFLNLNLPAPNGPLGNIRQSWITWRQVPRDQSPGSPIGYGVQGIQLGNGNAGDDPILP